EIDTAVILAVLRQQLAHLGLGALATNASVAFPATRRRFALVTHDEGRAFETKLIVELIREVTSITEVHEVRIVDENPECGRLCAGLRDVLERRRVSLVRGRRDVARGLAQDEVEFRRREFLAEVFRAALDD